MTLYITMRTIRTFCGLQHVRGVQLDVACVQRGYEKVHKEKGYANFEEHDEPVYGSAASSGTDLHRTLQHQLNALEQQATQQPQFFRRRGLFGKPDHTKKGDQDKERRKQKVHVPLDRVDAGENVGQSGVQTKKVVEDRVFAVDRRRRYELVADNVVSGEQNGEVGLLLDVKRDAQPAEG